VRTVYLGTSSFAAAVLERLAAGPHRPALVITRPDAPQGRGQKLAPPPVAARARELGLEVFQPERLHDEESLARIAAAEPEVLCVCAYGALIRDPLLNAYELLNVHPSLLPRWRGAAPVERAIMAGDTETGVSIMRVTAELDAGPVCLQAREPIHFHDDYGTLSARLERLGGELLVRALDERPECTEQDETRVTYARKLETRDRNLDFTRPPEEVERAVRALRPHIGARLPLPDGSYLGVHSARVAGDTLAPAGGRLRTDGQRLLLDCNGGALELCEVQPPGGRPMPAAAWVRGRPDDRLTSFFLDPKLPDRSLEELVALAREEWGNDAEWAPYMSALAYRGGRDVLAHARALGADQDPAARALGACVIGQLGLPVRSYPEESASALEAMAASERDPEVLAAIAHGFGHLGEPHGLEILLGLRAHPDERVRDGVATALAGRHDPRAVDALIELTSDESEEVRDWATFALGTLAPQDTPELREALAGRLADEDAETRVEAVHGLAMRGDLRAVEPALELLAQAASGEAAGPVTVWKQHALRTAASRLAELSGDERFAAYVERASAPAP